MARFTFAQLERLILDAGVAADLAPTLAAIALAESGGCSYAFAGPQDWRPVAECLYRKTATEKSYGLWQINTCSGLNAAECAGIPPQLDLFDPLTNARAAAVKAHEQGLGAWSTYTNQSYRQFLPGRAVTPARDLPSVRIRPSADTTAAGEPSQLPGAWHRVSYALGVVVPTRDKWTRYASNRFLRVIRKP